MLSFTSAGLPCHLYLFQVQPETDRFYLTSHLSVAAPLSATHWHACTHIKNMYMYTQCTDELPTWTRWACCSTNSVRAMDQHLTADMAEHSLPFFHLYHTPCGTNSQFGFCFHLGTWSDSEGRGELYSMPIELKGNCHGTTTAGSWDSSGSHFGPGANGLLWVVTERQTNSEWVSSIRLWI